MENARLSVIKERYMQDELPTRLGGLATNLMRIASVVNHPGSRQVVDKLLEESKFFIEWTAPDATLDKQTALVELQIELARWHYGWHRDSADQAKRAHLAQKARSWAERVLEMSGLLTEKQKRT